MKADVAWAGAMDAGTVSQSCSATPGARDPAEHQHFTKAYLVAGGTRFGSKVKKKIISHCQFFSARSEKSA